jgi:F420-dependent oxidoreductase-like protein
MKVGLQINRFDFPGGEPKIGENVKNISIAAEDAGFESIWVMDHFFQLPMIGPYTEPMLEAYTALGYIGTMVTGVIYREPAVLINAVTTLDVLSGGRAYFGIGAGWNDQEANALGLLDPLHSNRFDRLEDVLELTKQMWAGDSKPFKGKIYELKEPHLSPQPVSKPHPPILIGGGGEEKTLRLVAKYGDACNLFARDIEGLTHKLEVLKKHCQEIGRNYDEIEKTVLGGQDINKAADNPEEAIEFAKELAKLGVQHIIYAASKDADPSYYAKFAPTVKEINTL